MKRKYIIFGSIIILVIIIWIVVNYVSNLDFKVASVQPSLNKVSTSSPYIDVNFNKLPDETSIDIKSNPDAVINHTVNKKTLRLFLKTPLIADYGYKVTLSAKTKNGQSISNYEIKFTPKKIPYNQLPKDQQKYIIREQDKAFQDPVLKHLPYGTLDFSLIAENRNGKTVINARLLLSQADTNSGEEIKNKTIATYKKEVVNYIRSLGVDPSNYTINYILVEQP